jgi:ABC-type Fe3+ transport system substrate-binding protein
MRRAALLIPLALAAACHGRPPAPLEPVRLFVGGGLPGDAAVELARASGVAQPRLVATVEEAEVAWLPNPVAAIALGDRAAPGTAPEQPGVPEAYLDPRRRFAPVGATTAVIIARDGIHAGFAPRALRELADPRVRGQVALVRLGQAEGPMWVAALELAYGERGTRGWLRELAANAPRLEASEVDVVASVASGRVRYGLVGSLVAGAAAARDGLRLVYTDQGGSGCVAIPTALVLLPGAGPAARKLAAWMAGPSAEELLVRQVVGLLPVRTEVAPPPGVEATWNLRLLTVDWSALAVRCAYWERELVGWPPLR